MPDELREPAFGLDDFGKAKVLKNSEALATSVLMVLFGKPGFLPSLPDIGMDIGQYTYDFFDDIDVSSIKAQLAYQLPLVTDYVTAGEIDVRKVMNGDQGVLLFMLPMEQYVSNNNLVIGVETNINGGMSYNFALMASELGSDS